MKLSQWVVALFPRKRPPACSAHGEPWTEHEIVEDFRVYRGRTCSQGCHQTKCDGPMGDKQWHDFQDAWRNDWERESYEKGLKRRGMRVPNKGMDVSDYPPKTEKH